MQKHTVVVSVTLLPLIRRFSCYENTIEYRLLVPASGMQTESISSILDFLTGLSMSRREPIRCIHLKSMLRTRKSTRMYR
jgi:hypothetical protein